ncbi:MAG: hypothetical protein ACYDBQ_05145 [Thermoplasmatota archaeon]
MHLSPKSQALRGLIGTPAGIPLSIHALWRGGHERLAAFTCPLSEVRAWIQVCPLDEGGYAVPVEALLAHVGVLCTAGIPAGHWLRLRTRCVKVRVEDAAGRHVATMPVFLTGHPTWALAVGSCRVPLRDVGSRSEAGGRWEVWPGGFVGPQGIRDVRALLDELGFPAPENACLAYAPDTPLWAS